MSYFGYGYCGRCGSWSPLNSGAQCVDGCPRPPPTGVTIAPTTTISIIPTRVDRVDSMCPHGRHSYSVCPWCLGLNR